MSIGSGKGCCCRPERHNLYLAYWLWKVTYIPASSLRLIELFISNACAVRATYSFLYADHGLSQSLRFLPKGSQARGTRLPEREKKPKIPRGRGGKRKRETVVGKLSPRHRGRGWSEGLIRLIIPRTNVSSVGRSVVHKNRNCQPRSQGLFLNWEGKRPGIGWSHDTQNIWV